MFDSETLWSEVRRIDDLRFAHPQAAYADAAAALEALASLPAKSGALVFALWATYGSTCRSTGRFDAAELALLTAARLAGSDLRRLANVSERLAYLRRDQGRGEEARCLVRYYLEYARHAGGVTYGQKLSSAAAILTRLGDYAAAAAALND